MMLSFINDKDIKCNFNQCRRRQYLINPIVWEYWNKIIEEREISKYKC
jgi:hypothetical protein